MIKRGIALCTFNREKHISAILSDILDTMPINAKLVVCDDGSTDNTIDTIIKEFPGLTLIRGKNKGVGFNKNRALWALQDCHFLCILEDDLTPKEKDWFEIYEEASKASHINHFCRVQDKEVEETIPTFSAYMNSLGFTPIYGPSPRGDLTFLTKKVITTVGGFNPEFKGAGYAHGEYSDRVAKSGLIGHPLNWIDIKEARDKFEQVGDREGGRWLRNEEEIKSEIRRNRKIRKKLDSLNYTYHPLILL